MPSSSTTRFAQRYEAALHRHLHTQADGRVSDADLRALGNRAAALHLDPHELARMHHHALGALARSTPSSRPAKLRRAGGFLSGLLKQISKSRTTGKKRVRLKSPRAAKLKTTLERMQELRRVLKLETARRKSCETELKVGARHNQHLLAESTRMREQSRTLVHRLILAQEEERKEISRDLHDEVAQILAGINVQLAGLSESAAINDQALRRRISQAQHLVGQSVEAVHRFARELRPALLDDLGLVPALRSLIRTLPGRNGLRVELTAYHAIEEINAEQRTVLYRVSQEALTNIVRHARARDATIHITRRAGRVCLAVHDDGCSFNADRVLTSRSSQRLGLVGMRERVEMVGGIFSIRSKPNFGTTVRATIPLQPQE